MDKTSGTYKETKYGVLAINEIERRIMDNVVQTQKYILRYGDQLTIDEDFTKDLHQLIAGSVFEQAGQYRSTNVTVGAFSPPEFFAISEHMQNWNADYAERQKHVSTEDDAIELCAWMMHRFLWIHPFFDYNGRTARLLGEVHLLQNNLPIVSFQSTERQNFVEAVKIATDNDDLAPLIKVIRS